MSSTAEESKELPFTYTLDQVAGNVFSLQADPKWTEVNEGPAMRRLESYINEAPNNDLAGWNFVNEYVRLDMDPAVPAVIVLAKGEKLLEGWSEAEKRFFLDRAINERQLQLQRRIDDQLRLEAYYPLLGNIDYIALNISQNEVTRLDICKQKLRERVTPSDPHTRR